MAIPKKTFPKGTEVKYEGEMWIITYVFNNHPTLTWYDLQAVNPIGESNIHKEALSIEHNELEIILK